MSDFITLEEWSEILAGGLAPGSVSGAGMGVSSSDFENMPTGMFNMDFSLGPTDSYNSNLYKILQQKYPLGSSSGIEYTRTGCITLDKYINQISEEINQWQLDLLEGVRPPSYYGIDYNSWVSGQQLQDYKNKEEARLKEAESFLKLAIPYRQKLKDNFIKQDCRNKIETIRQEETANLFSSTTYKSELGITEDSNKKIYFLTGIGALVVLTTLIIVTRKKK